MKNSIIWSRAVDWKITLGIILAAGALVGYNLPTIIPTQANDLRVADAFMATAIGILIWGVFKLIEPSGFTRNGQKWLVAEFIVVPLIWILLVVAIGIWFRHMGIASDYKDFIIL